MKSCIVLFSEGTEEAEALTPLDLLRRAGVSCTLAKVPAKTEGAEKRSNVACGSHGIRVVCDADIKDVRHEKPDMVIVPGGMPGTTNIDCSDDAKDLILSVYEAGGTVAAICAAPSVLGHMGLLDGRKATCYPGFEKELKGALPADGKVVRDGNVITAAGMGVAVAFGLECVKALCGDGTAKKLADGIIYG